MIGTGAVDGLKKRKIFCRIPGLGLSYHLCFFVLLIKGYGCKDYFLPNDGLQFIEVIRQKGFGIFERKFGFSFPLKERKNILP